MNDSYISNNIIAYKNKYEVYYRTLVKVYQLIDIACDLIEKVEDKSGFRVS